MDVRYQWISGYGIVALYPMERKLKTKILPNKDTTILNTTWIHDQIGKEMENVPHYANIESELKLIMA